MKGNQGTKTWVPGKLTHAGAKQLSGSEYSTVDYNRAGLLFSYTIPASIFPLKWTLLPSSQPPHAPCVTAAHSFRFYEVFVAVDIVSTSESTLG